MERCFSELTVSRRAELPSKTAKPLSMFRPENTRWSCRNNCLGWGFYHVAQEIGMEVTLVHMEGVKKPELGPVNMRRLVSPFLNW